MFPDHSFSPGPSAKTAGLEGNRYANGETRPRFAGLRVEVGGGGPDGCFEARMSPLGRGKSRRRGFERAASESPQEQTGQGGGQPDSVGEHPAGGGTEGWVPSLIPARPPSLRPPSSDHMRGRAPLTEAGSEAQWSWSWREGGTNGSGFEGPSVRMSRISRSSGFSSKSSSRIRSPSGSPAPNSVSPTRRRRS